MDGKTCKCGSKVAPIFLARINMYKNQARVAQQKEKKASDREKVAIERKILTHAMEEESRGREKVVKRREEKARVRERIAKEKLQKYKFALVVSWGFLLFFMCFLVGWENLEQSHCVCLKGKLL